MHIFIFVEIWILYDAIHNFSVWLRTGSNPLVGFVAILEKFLKNLFDMPTSNLIVLVSLIPD